MVKKKKLAYAAEILGFGLDLLFAFDSYCL